MRHSDECAMEAVIEVVAIATQDSAGRLLAAIRAKQVLTDCSCPTETMTTTGEGPTLRIDITGP